MKKRITICVAALAAVLMLLSACGGSTMEAVDWEQKDVPAYYVGTYTFFDYQRAKSDATYTPAKDADGNDILEFTIKADGTFVANGKEYPAHYYETYTALADGKEKITMDEPFVMYALDDESISIDVFNTAEAAYDDGASGDASSEEPNDAESGDVQVAPADVVAGGFSSGDDEYDQALKAAGDIVAAITVSVGKNKWEAHGMYVKQ